MSLISRIKTNVFSMLIGILMQFLVTIGAIQAQQYLGDPA